MDSGNAIKNCYMLSISSQYEVFASTVEILWLFLMVQEKK